ncbi:NF-kappa-B inhibitor cactus-like [Uloborus diversus]|uniref:NF-kappa-B inhibitor cactus-like n=1 Tax=Uloborus diversus TaxID=327109 RepID=UPI002409A203|nr:NF-kappa-B inhibitor cactus-like [Uloborus diversus]
METNTKNKDQTKLDAGGKEKLRTSKHHTSETDSSISLTFDSAVDCSYKSDEISLTRTSTTENISSLSISDCSVFSKSDLRFDSGLGTDCISPLTSESCLAPEEVSKEITTETYDKNRKLTWKDIFTPDKDGDTLLHLAIVEALSDITCPLIQLAPHPDFLDITNDLYQTPLHLAALTGKSNIVRKLIVAGATVDIQDHSGNIPLHIAARSGDLDCVELILMPISDAELELAKCSYRIFARKDVDLSHLINLKNYDGQSCVHLAASGGFKKVLECLFKYRGDINEQDGKSGRTPLHYAIENENVELVQLLLTKCRANPYVKNYAGQTAFCIARSLHKRKPSEIRRSIIEILKPYAEKWDSSSDFEWESSSDEADATELNQKNSQEHANK